MTMIYSNTIEQHPVRDLNRNNLKILIKSTTSKWRKLAVNEALVLHYCTVLLYASWQLLNTTYSLLKIVRILLGFCALLCAYYEAKKVHASSSACAPQCTIVVRTSDSEYWMLAKILCSSLRMSLRDDVLRKSKAHAWLGNTLIEVRITCNIASCL